MESDPTVAVRSTYLEHTFADSSESIGSGHSDRINKLSTYIQSFILSSTSA
jgi:hypothetical protein